MTTLSTIKALPLSRIHVSTSEYQLAHGRLPRGTGTWAFYFGDPKGCGEPLWIKGQKLYSVALAEAKREAQALGCDWIEVAT